VLFSWWLQQMFQGTYLHMPVVDVAGGEVLGMLDVMDM
jgi:hypothetical protein